MHQRKLLICLICFVIISPLLSQKAVKLKSGPVFIAGYFPEFNEGDSLSIKCFIYKSAFEGSNILHDTMVSANKPFVISINGIDRPSTIAFSMNLKHLKKYKILLFTPNIQVEPNDTIRAEKTGVGYSYTGSANVSAVTECLKIGGALYNKRWNRQREIIPTTKDYEFLDSVTLVELSCLESIKNKISSSVYAISLLNILTDNQYLKKSTEIILTNKENRLKLLNSAYRADSSFPNYFSIKKSLFNYRDTILELIERTYVRYAQYLAYSAGVSALIRVSYIRDSCLRVDRPFNFEKYYAYLKSEFRGLLREKLISEALYQYRKQDIRRAFFVHDALGFFVERQYIDYVNTLTFAFPGDPAFKFELPDIKDNLVRLDSLIGKIVILDFWYTGCVNCVVLHPKFERIVDYFSDNTNVLFCSISIDRDKDKWLTSVNRGDKFGRYTSTDKNNVVNLYTDGLADDHPLIKFHRVQGYPTILIIGPKGEIGPTAVDPRLDEGEGMIKQISSLLVRIGKL
jgi:thiol-disulfide isomerase/thioredoxin